MKTVDCDYVKSLFIDYLDDNLNNKEKQEVENHLVNCSGCRKQIEQFKTLNSLFSEPSEIDHPQSSRNILFNRMEKVKSRIYFIKRYSKIAASIAIFILGSTFGIFLQNYNLNKSKISQLENKVNQLQEQVIFEKLNEDQTASEKIMAINYAYEKQNLEISFANLLINILNTDGNINVRLAALDALSNFTKDSFIHDNLLNSLNIQDDPRLQVGLINLISTLNDDKSKETIIEFLNQDDIDPEVRSYAAELALIY